MKIPLLDLKNQYKEIRSEIQAAINDVLDSGQYILGEQVLQLEEEIANYCGVKYGVGVASGTDALLLSLKALDIGEGDEVLLPAFSFIATAGAISKLKATPVFLDIEQDTYNLNPFQIEKKITDKTKAIIPVHLFGQLANMKKIKDIADKYNLKIVEDACQAIGGTYKGKGVGYYGDLATLSFFPSKNLGAYGDGGMILSNNYQLASRIKSLRIHGAKSKYRYTEIAYNSRLDEIQAAVLRVKLKYLDKWIAGRRRVAKHYNRLFKEYNLDQYISLADEKHDFQHVYHQYVIKTEKRDGLKDYLKGKGIATAIYYPIPLHLQECYRDLGYKEGDLALAENLCNKVLALPIDPALKEDEIEYVVKSIYEFNKKFIIEKKKSLQEQLLKKIKDKEAVVGVIGLGYVGLPLAVEKAKAGYKTIGFDIQSKKVKMVNRGENYIGDIIAGDLKKVVKNGRLRATNDLSFLKEVDCILICVPTPLDDYSQPDTSYLRKTGENIAKYIQKGVLVILESTTYPGTTENFLRPILEKSGLKAGEDFFLVFSPERVDPGNKFYNIKNTPKVVGGINQESSDLAKELYQNIIEEKVYQVSSPAVAEMEKILENTYRYVNIALVNEMAILANEMGLDIWEVIEAASTKPYGYKAFYPGPGVGGHCIPIDPFYLSWLAKQFKFRTKFIELAADINMQMPKYILERINDLLNREGKQLKDSKILQLGLAYKQDIDDIRSSPGIELFKLLKKKGVILEYNDPFINEFKIDEQCYQSMVLGKEVLESVDLVFITCKHSSYDYNFIQKHAKLIFDTRNAMKGLKNKENVELL